MHKSIGYKQGSPLTAMAGESPTYGILFLALCKYMPFQVYSFNSVTIFGVKK
jgi:hypothetical protein